MRMERERMGEERSDGETAFYVFLSEDISLKLSTKLSRQFMLKDRVLIQPTF